MNKFTKGEWEVRIEQPYPHTLSQILTVATDDFDVVCVPHGIRNQHDANLIATAGSAATRLAEMGFDAVLVIEKLPRIAEYISKGNNVDAFGLLEQCRGE